MHKGGVFVFSLVCILLRTIQRFEVTMDVQMGVLEMGVPRFSENFENRWASFIPSHFVSIGIFPSFHNVCFRVILFGATPYGLKSSNDFLIGK